MSILLHALFMISLLSGLFLSKFYPCLLQVLFLEQIASLPAKSIMKNWGVGPIPRSDEQSEADKSNQILLVHCFDSKLHCRFIVHYDNTSLVIRGKTAMTCYKLPLCHSLQGIIFNNCNLDFQFGSYYLT